MRGRVDLPASETPIDGGVLECDQVALAVEIRGLHAGTAVFLLKDGRIVNRFAGRRGWGDLARRVDRWIAKHGETLRANNRDLLDEAAS